MSLLQQLATQALIGSERTSPSLPPAQGALGELLSEMKTTTELPDTLVLRAAGVLSIGALAGFEPLTVAPTHSPSPLASRPIPDNKTLLNTLHEILDDAPQPLWVEALQALARCEMQLPPRLLPAFLNHGARHKELRPHLAPVVGERGFWLAGLNPDWAYLFSQSQVLEEHLWETGTREQRTAFLQLQRQQDPAAARQRLQDALGDTDARERALLTETLRTGLTLEDEPLLNRLLGDRSKEVRQVAADLLAGLSASGYVQRMIDRVKPQLVSERKLLRKTLTLEPPETFDPDWKQDAIEESRAQSEPLGQRGWWLYQLARTLPLSWWEQATGFTPAELLKWAQGSDWSLALLRAWHHALLREANRTWAGALLAQPSTKEFSFDGFKLINLLSANEQEDFWLALLDAGQKQIAHGDLLARVVQSRGLETQVSTQLARKVFQRIKKDLADDQSKWDYTLRNSLVDFACLIPPDCFADAIHGWPVDQPNTQFFADTVARVLRVIEQRKVLIEHLS
ncbi:DUF5691 domain-containing protein [Rheinheimera baltica]|uniref:DUF5691 domain-containing protein n=1 Tax=Rheinheimera baltica TaxID=67576 RepID=UPI00273D7736|nr:DUF5691 domain-containing protein [Rheinheimera baltica]MDP5189322.1 DUF5691 domain-containing protein [Rheinheimera baltica]